MFVLIIIIFLVTDYVRYKPVLIVDGIGGILHYVAIANRPSKLRIQVTDIYLLMNKIFKVK